MKCIIYCRVSSKEQEETGYSLDSQEKILREYSQRKELVIEKIFRIAESASGAKQREVFDEMMKYVDKYHVHNLLCEKVDRLTRNMKDAVTVNDWIEGDARRRVHFVKQNLIIHKEAKSDEKFRWDIEIVLAKKYIANLSEEVKKGQREKLAQGGLPTKPPIGYRTVGEKGRKTHVLDERMAPILKKMLEMYASGNHSMLALVEFAEVEGLRTRGGKHPVKSHIEKILKDPFYYGAVRWNGEIQNVPGTHPPLISKEVYDKIQVVRSGKKAPQFNRHFFQFRKMLKCGECGGTITAEIQKGIVYYHCNHYKKCSQEKYTPEKQIEEKLFGVFKFFENITPTEAERIKAKIKQNHAQEIEYKEKTIKTLNERYSALQRRLDNLYNDRLDEKISVGFWQEKQKEILGEQTALQEKLTKLKSEEAKYFEIWLNILDLARRAREIYEKRSPEQRRILLSHLFSNLALTDEEVKYDYKKAVARLALRVQQRIDAEKTFELQKNSSKQGSSVSTDLQKTTLLRG